jgi:transmembrane sensor
MTLERFEFLFRQYKNDWLSQEDWKEFQSAVRSGVFDSFLKNEFTLLAESDEVHGKWSPELENAMWQVIQKNKTEKPELSLIAGNAGNQISSSLKTRKRLIAYLSIAASLSCIFYFWLNRPVHQKMIPASSDQKQTVILPGTNKAILTLGDGSHIVLDSSHNGQIAKMGNASFRKSGGTLRVSFLTGKTSDQEPEEAVITTPRGGQFELILPDGSKVWLNSASSLRFPSVFKSKQREVKLDGEGYFEIAPNAKMPFIVSVNDMKVSVLGTHFDIMAYPDEKDINTTLFEGAVNVSKGTQTKQLKPGQQASMANAGDQLNVSQADLQKAIAWKNGLFQFDHTDLSTIMRQLARWYDIEIIYQTKPDTVGLGGSISRNLDLNGALRMLEANSINHFKIEGKKVIVLQ